jgi:2-polyprenyl-6-methoxyphenol hydroxylase-like FAD-dependent oxidoreductase
VEQITARCCIAGGGPAGIMLGFLMARAGIKVVVLEKHADFLRDFRGDTLHPSTLDIMHELGILDGLMQRPHRTLAQFTAEMGDTEIILADFTRLSTRCRFVALMPQWDFLDFLSRQAQRYPGFELRMQTEVTGLIEHDRRVIGLSARGVNGPLEIHTELVVGADGRHSAVRRAAGLAVCDLGAPIDVLWMRLSRNPSDPEAILRFNRGRILATADRGDYWQCGLVIAKGASEELRRKGIDALRGNIAEIAPFLTSRLEELKDWNDVRLLTVRIDRLRRWYRTGLLCIGDAAHAMSPVGGVGINLAIQDAVAAANILVGPLLAGRINNSHLAAVQRRRSLPTRVTQVFQMIVQKQLVERVLADSNRVGPPWIQRLLNGSRPVRWIRGRMIGVGVRPEHIRTPDCLASSKPAWK